MIENKKVYNSTSYIPFRLIKLFSLFIIFCGMGTAGAQSISLLSPNKGEKWEANSTHLIKWESSSISKVKIEYSYNSGISWRTIIPSIDAFSGEYIWRVPDSQVPNVLIRISAVDNPDIYDIVDVPFSIIKIPQKLSKPKREKSTHYIWPLGDSITDGDGDPDHVGYREGLFNSLTNAGYDFSFVGTLESGLESSPPDTNDPNYNFYINGRHHDGHGGWEAYAEPYTNNSMYHHVNDWYNTVANINGTPPDLVLLHIGTNDIGEINPPYYDTPEALSYQLHLLLDKLNTLNPNMTIFLAQIINRDDTSNFQNRYERTHDFNLILKDMADTLIGQGRKIVVVNMEAALNYHPPGNTDLVDGVHPGVIGYSKMANVWYSAVSPFLQALPVELTSLTAKAIKSSIVLNWETATEVNNYGFEVERKVNSPDTEWKELSFVQGSGNSNSPKTYSFIDKNLIGGTKFLYRLKQIDTDGKFEYSEEVEIEIIPKEISLFQNYPNPFNPSTEIKFNLPAAAKVVLKIYNIIGQEVATLINGFEQAGFHSVKFEGASLPSGTYIYRFQTNNFVQSKKMLLLK